MECVHCMHVLSRSVQLLIIVIVHNYVVVRQVVYVQSAVMVCNTPKHCIQQVLTIVGCVCVFVTYPYKFYACYTCLLYMEHALCLTFCQVCIQCLLLMWYSSSSTILTTSHVDKYHQVLLDIMYSG